MNLWQDGVRGNTKGDSHLADDCHLERLFLLHFQYHTNDAHVLSRRDGFLADGVPDFAVAEQSLG